MSPRKALVTGAHGFVGRYVARALAGVGYEVRGLGHGSWLREEQRLWGLSDWRVADVTLETLITYAEKPDLIIHCAGSGSVAFSMSHPLQDYQRTVATTHAVLEYARTICPGAKIVLPSSAGVYGVVDTLPISVDAALRPSSPYGTHKKIAEELCTAYARHFGISCAIVRLFSVYGLGLRKQLLWDACGKINSGRLDFAGTGRETRDWLHVEDAAALMLHAAEHASPACPIVNGGTGAVSSIAEIVNAIVDAFGVVERASFSGLSRAGDPTDYRADVFQALAWGWSPTRDWRSEVVNYVQWFKDGAP